MKRFIWFKGCKAALFAVVAALLLVSTVMAYVSINTNDGAIDAGWYTTPFLTDPDDVGDEGKDILKFWTGVNATKSNFYFRAEMDARVPGPDGNYWLEAQLDCNKNGSLDAADIIVEYTDQNVSSDSVYTSDGTWTIWDTYDGTHGEYIAPNAYEWYSPTSGGNINWSTCLSASANIRLVLYQSPSGTASIIDQTDWRAFDTPTATQVQHLNTASSSNPLPALLIITLLCIGGWFVRFLYKA